MYKKSFSRRLFCVFNVVFMFLMMTVMLFPVLNVVAKAFNDGKDTSMGGITIYPRAFTLRNFEVILKDPAFIRAAIVSVLTVISGTILALLIQFMTAYVFLKRDLVGRSALLLFFMIPMYFGGGLIPTYILYARIGMLNNYLVYILPGCFSLYNMVIIRSYLRSIPSSLSEAARLDGASEIKILFGIYVPLSLPIIATISLWSAVGLWSDWTTALYFITKKQMYNLQYILVEILKETQKIQTIIQEAMMAGVEINISESNITTEAVRCAQIVVCVLPIVMVYPFLQKYFISGVTIGSVKD